MKFTIWLHQPGKPPLRHDSFPFEATNRHEANRRAEQIAGPSAFALLTASHKEPLSSPTPNPEKPS